MMRAAESGKRAARFEQFQGPKMNLLVASQGIRHGGAIARERWWIKNNAVPPRNNFLVRFDCSLSLEKVEDIRTFERALFTKAIRNSVSSCRSDGVSALVQKMDLGSARARSMQSKPAQETEAVENLCAFRELRYES